MRGLSALHGSSRPNLQLMEDSSQGLFNAVKNGSTEILSALLKTELYPPYEKLMETAVNANQEKALELLLEDEQSSAIDMDRAPPFHQQLILKIAKAEYSSIPMLKLLLKDASDDNLSFTLQSIIAAGKLRALQVLLAAGVDVNAGQGIALWQAVESNHDAMLDWLIQSGADVNTTYGKTALSVAVSKGYEIMVNRLLTAGANLQDPKQTALLNVFDNFVNLNILNALLEKQPNLQVTTPAGDTPLHLAARLATSYGDIQPFRKLWLAGADLGAENLKNQTPLTLLNKARPTTVDKLKKIGLDLTISIGEHAGTFSRSPLEQFELADNPLTQLGQILDSGTNLEDPKSTALLDLFSEHQCVLDGYIDLNRLDAILKTNPNLEMTNPSGNTPLHLAARIAVLHGNIKPFEKLWKVGADLNVKNKRHKTPLMLLTEARRETLDALKEVGFDLTVMTEQPTDFVSQSVLKQFPDVKANLEATIDTSIPWGKEALPSEHIQIADPSFSSFYSSIQKKTHQEQLPTQIELLHAVRKNDIKQIKNWEKEERFHSSFDLGLGLIEAIKLNRTTVFHILLEQNQQLFLPEHQEEAIRVAAEKNLGSYITSLLRMHPNQADQLRGIALIAAVKAGHQELTLDMLDGASDQSLVPALNNAFQQGRWDILKDLLKHIPEIVKRMSERLETVSSLISREPEKKSLIKTLTSLQKTFRFLLKESVDNGYTEIINLLFGIEGKYGLLTSDERAAIMNAEQHKFPEIVRNLRDLVLQDSNP